MATSKNEKAVSTIADIEVQTSIQVVDNTDVQPVAERPVETEEYELIGGMVQVNYK